MRSHVLRIYVTLRPTAVSCETVDRCIASLTVGCFRSMPHAGLMLFDCLDCSVGLRFYCFFFCMRLFCLLLCAFRVWTGAFVSLYVSEFSIAACGVSLLRERPAISQAPRGLPKGWTPTLFSLGAGLLVLCH